MNATSTTPLGAQVAEWNKFSEEESHLFDDVDAFFGPYECKKVLLMRMARVRNAFLAKYGYQSFEDFKSTVAQRTSARWVYFNLYS